MRTFRLIDPFGTVIAQLLLPEGTQFIFPAPIVVPIPTVNAQAPWRVEIT